MRPNNLRKIFAGGGTALNGWLAIASTYSAELMAHQGFESVTIDLQHGPVDFAAASESAGTPCGKVKFAPRFSAGTLSGSG